MLARSGEKRFKLKDSQQPAAKIKKKIIIKIFLAIKQERIGFLHPNENSSCEIHESVSKHNSMLAIMRSYLRNWAYGFQVGEKKKVKSFS